MSTTQTGDGLGAGTPAGIDNTREYGMREAIARLEGREYIPVKPTIWQRLHRLEAMTRSPDSIYAMKVAAAALVFGALIWADGSRAFFIKYNIAGSLLTIVVALSVHSYYPINQPAITNMTSKEPLLLGKACGHLSSK